MRGCWCWQFLIVVSLITFSMCMWFCQSKVIPYALAAASPACAPSSPPAIGAPLIQAPASPNVVFINEVLPEPGPHTAWNCAGNSSTGAINSWIELYNPQSLALDLYSAHATLDNGPNTPAVGLPFGSAITAHGFLVVFPPKNIILSAVGGVVPIRLIFPGGPVIDQVKLPQQLDTDQSYARIPDGGPGWQTTSVPTIGSGNSSVAVTPTPTLAPTIMPTTQTPIPSPPPEAQHVSHTLPSGNPVDATTGADSQTGNVIQPVWQDMHLPDNNAQEHTTKLSSTPQTRAPAIEPTQTAAPTDDIDRPRKLLLSAGCIIVGGALIWILRRFART